MTDAEYAQIKAKIEALFAWWARHTGLGYWHITYVWDRERAPCPPDEARPPMMETEVRWQYQDARITIYLPSALETDDATLERIVVHECLHIFLNEMRPLGDWGDPCERALMQERHAHEEHTATMLAKAFVWVRDQVRDEHHGTAGQPEAV